MRRFAKLQLKRLWNIAILLLVLLASRLTGEVPPSDLVQTREFLNTTKVNLASAVIAAQMEFSDAVPFKAGISRWRPVHAFEVLVLSHGQVVRVEVDAICGDVLEGEEEERTHVELVAIRRIVGRARVGLGEAIAVAAQRTTGTPIDAELRDNGKNINAVIGLLLNGARIEHEVRRIPMPGEQIAKRKN